MPQKDINFKTLQLYNQTRRVPKVTEVDSEAIVIASSTAAYANKLLGILEGPGYLNYNSQCRCHPMYHTYDMHKGFFKEAAAERMEYIVKHSSIPPLETKK
ncbi:hypothetical protein BGW42_005969 [Actinomortierella wolfii]|nr:hypothetical protein BGW42_005969 [Actinomortierella wolfii]